jgi:hypothetical protein
VCLTCVPRICVPRIVGGGINRRQTDLISPDHPGFHDTAYRKRRAELTAIAQSYQHGFVARCRCAFALFLCWRCHGCVALRRHSSHCPVVAALGFRSVVVLFRVCDSWLAGRRHDVVLMNHHTRTLTRTYAHTDRSLIPRIDYNKDEVETWNKVYTRLMDMSSQYACEEYRAIMPAMEKYVFHFLSSCRSLPFRSCYSGSSLILQPEWMHQAWPWHG